MLNKPKITQAKLESVLSAEDKIDEKTLLYILCMCRRLCEDKHGKKRYQIYPTLMLITDWALHIKLTRNEYGKELIEKYSTYFKQHGNNAGFDFLNSFRLFTEFIEELHRFLDTYTLPKHRVECKKEVITSTILLLQGTEFETDYDIRLLFFNDVQQTDANTIIDFTMIFKDKTSTSFAVDVKLLTEN